MTTDSDALTGFCMAVLERLGVPSDEARIIAVNLVDTDLRGIDSHGVVRFPVYVRRIEDGGTNPRPIIRVERETRTTAIVDGGNGLGQLVGVRAMEIAIGKAKEGDCVFVSVNNSNHYGAAGYYASMAARENMIGFSFTVGAINHMAPWGGTEALLGNNPFAFALPTRQGFSVVLDMACSVAARGKIIIAAQEGRPIPEGWANDSDGLPTTDPIKALQGLVMPVGGPKGYALALTVGMMSTMLSGAFFGTEVGDLYKKTGAAQNSGHLFGVLPIESFTGLGGYLDRVDKAIDEMRNARRGTGVERIYLPGELEHLKAIERRRQGIPLGPELTNELRELGMRFGVRFP
jgi:LDH2 family malate/lactate/ureidoglycolate dehydrogenase